MKAGRELDILVAEKVMGQVWQGGNPIPNYDGKWPWPPPYSTDIAAAWQMVEKTDMFGKLEWILSRSRDQWVISKRVSGGYGPSNWNTIAQGDTYPLTICLAALKAVGYKESV